jgi:predicted 3-demethylubiquinone-9 3-methyltransferase (glyoxalase superfamily)
LKGRVMQRITPFLWFDGNAEEAANFYVSIFKNSKIGKVSRYGDAGPGPKGAVMSVTFQLEGQEFFALNGGSQFKFTPAISFFVNCQTQPEVDELWEKLSAGGKKIQCGWLTDKFGITWQIVPTVLSEMLNDKDPEKSKRVMQAMMKMIKLDIGALERAYRGE